MNTVISGSTILAMTISAAATTLLPIGLLIFWTVRRKLSMLPLGLGFVSFLVSQVLTRIPLLTTLNQLPAWQSFSAAHPILMIVVIGGLTTGLFEESARLGGALLLKEKRTFRDGCSFGIGHGFCEVILLTGMSEISNLVLALMWNSGLLEQARLPQEALAAAVEALAGTAPGLFYLAILERFFAAVYHLAASLLIFWGASHGKKGMTWLAAVLCHTLLNSGAVLLAQYLSIWASELFMAVFAGALLAAVLRLKETFPLEKFSNPNLKAE